MTSQPHRSALEQVRSVLEPGRVYRRADLTAVSNAVDRHLQALVQAGDSKEHAVRIGSATLWLVRKLPMGASPCPRQTSIVYRLMDEWSVKYIEKTQIKNII